MIYIITKDSFAATLDVGVEYHPGDIIPMGAHKGWKVVCTVPYDTMCEDIENAVSDELFHFQCGRGIGDMPDSLKDEISDSVSEFCESLIHTMAKWFAQCRYN